ncbi:unnamed protein product [Paramecium sonneborni]|uniref:Major facilitator superfamily (MFS) profile domain-containing protein n=1 Tax=Paramecium sonneborni TaxID=65129 RepID=A0A8S1RIZ3_9CILI|nr:unnamed protein product [Paramecium sonneborni]
MASQVIPLQTQEIEYLQTEMNQSAISKEMISKNGHNINQKRGTVQLFNEKDEEVNSIGDLTIIMIGIMSGSFTFGYAITYLTLSFDTVFDQINLKGSKNEEQGLFSAILPIGCIVGAVSSHFLMQILTRNQTLIVADICGMLSILSLVPIREMILAFRFMYGVCNGISCIVMPIYIKELCPQKYYERFSVMAGFLIGIGVLVAFIFGLGYLNDDLRGPDTHWWQVMFAVPPVVFFFRQLIVTVIYKMDSPISLLEKGMQLQAKNVVERLYTQKSVEQAFLKAQLRVQYNEEHREGLSSIFSKKHGTTVAIGCVLMFIYTWCGIFAVFSYSSQFFASMVDNDLTLNTIFSLILGISQQLPAYVSKFFYGKWGKRSLLIFGLIFIICCQIIVIGLSYTENSAAVIIKFIVLCLFAFVYALTISPICWSMTPEINSSEGTYFCIISVFVWQLFMLYVFPFMLEGMSMTGSFILFTILTFLCLIFSYFFVKETKGLNHREIDILYGKGE